LIHPSFVVLKAFIFGLGSDGAGHVQQSGTWQGSPCAAEGWALR